ncbi:hypothetical protein [Streptomyces sp. 061-3]|uniref:hypothetical protein n=1 Tax=Streptomyces sp. 061-3 TaxID=2789268 RepID=UPI003980C232
MSQEPEFVSYVKGCMSCLVFLVIALVIGTLVVRAIGVGGVVFFIVASAVIVGVFWRHHSANKKGE